MKNFNLKIGEIEIEVLKFKIEETEIVVKCKNKIEMPTEIKTPRELFLFLKKYKDEIENVEATTETFNKEVLVAVSNCKKFYYEDKKDGIVVSREDGDISLKYGDAEIYTSNEKHLLHSDNVREMFYPGNTNEIEPIINDSREKYKKLFQLYPIVKSENQIFDLTFSAGEYVKIDREVENIPKYSLIIGEGFVSSVINNETIDEITFHSEVFNQGRMPVLKKADELSLRIKDTAIEFDENDVMTCWHNGNQYIFCEGEMTDSETRASAEEMQQDLNEIKKLLKMSLQLIDSELIEEMIRTVENTGELSEFESKMKILEDFETL